MTTDTEALRAQFEREFGKSPYGWPLSRFEKSAWAGQYTDLKTQYGWEGYQAGHAAAKAEIAAAVAAERERCIGIIESHHIPVGNSAAGEMACEWTYDALKTIRDAIRAGAKEPSDG